MSTHNLCFEQKYEKYQFLFENFLLLEVKFSIYLNRPVFLMVNHGLPFVGSTRFIELWPLHATDEWPCWQVPR